MIVKALIPDEDIFERWYQGEQMKQIAADIGLTTLYVSDVIKRVLDEKTGEKHWSGMHPKQDQIRSQRLINRRQQRNSQ